MISVIIPVYNDEKYFSGMLDCVSRQTYRDFELIIVNDGSTDGTQGVINSFISTHAECVVKCINQENKGQSAARNRGFSEAEGEYIAFLDSDDTITDDYLEKLLNLAESRNADVVKCTFDEYDDVTGKLLLRISAGDRNIEYEPGRFYCIHYTPCAGLYRTAFLKKYGIVFSTGELMEDSPYNLMANNLANRIAVTDETLYYHRMHAGSTMANVADAQKDPKIPYNGFESAIKKVNEYISGEEKDISDYWFIRVLTDYVTLRYMTQGKTVRRKLCSYAKRIMDEYYSNAASNPYIFGNKAGNLKKIPFAERAAVKSFVISWKLGLIYPYSCLCAAALRSKS